MKKILFIVLALIILLNFSACRKSEELPDSSDLDIGDFNRTINIFIASGVGYIPTDAEVTDWEFYISDKYGVSIDLAYVVSTDDPAEFVSGENLILLENFLGMTDLKGIIFTDRNKIPMLRETGLVSPVNDFINDVNLIKSANDKIFGGFTDLSGNIWAVPYMDTVELPMRLYCDEWLNAAGMKTPVDLKDFRDFAEFIAFEDPDGNGINDTFIQEYRGPVSIYSSFSDIFLAYGCYLSRYNPFNYNPKKGIVENAFLNENFPEAISYIKDLVDDGLLEKGYAEQRGLREPDYSVASVVSGSTYPEYWEGWQAGYYLIGTNETELSSPYWGQSGMMVLNGTENPAELLNALSSISETKSGFLDLYYGREGYNYEMHEGYCDLVNEGENNEERNPIRLYFGNTKSFDAMVKDNIRFCVNGDLSELDANDVRYEDNDIKEQVSALMDSSVIYIVPDFDGYEQLWELYMLVPDESYMLLTEIIRGITPVDEAVEKYRAALEAKGILDILDEINSGIDH